MSTLNYSTGQTQQEDGEPKTKEKRKTNFMVALRGGNLGLKAWISEPRNFLVLLGLFYLPVPKYQITCTLHLKRQPKCDPFSGALLIKKK